MGKVREAMVNWLKQESFTLHPYDDEAFYKFVCTSIERKKKMEFDDYNEVIDIYVNATDRIDESKKVEWKEKFDYHRYEDLISFGIYINKSK